MEFYAITVTGGWHEAFFYYLASFYIVLVSRPARGFRIQATLTLSAKSISDLEESLSESGIKTILFGYAKQVRKLREAIREGFDEALEFSILHYLPQKYRNIPRILSFDFL